MENRFRHTPILLQHVVMVNEWPSRFSLYGLVFMGRKFPQPSSCHSPSFLWIRNWSIIFLSYSYPTDLNFLIKFYFSHFLSYLYFFQFPSAFRLLLQISLVTFIYFHSPFFQSKSLIKNRSNLNLCEKR
jgi:hypothetical protein